jgi:hypothetical protein
MPYEALDSFVLADLASIKREDRTTEKRANRLNAEFILKYESQYFFIPG